MKFSSVFFLECGQCVELDEVYCWKNDDGKTCAVLRLFIGDAFISIHFGSEHEALAFAEKYDVRVTRG